MHIHLIGVGGIAMGNLAAMLKSAGHRVSGSDKNLYPPMSDRLREWDIETLPFDAENVKSKDLIIVGNAMSRGNPEVEEMLNLNLNYMSMSQALGEFFLKGKKVIVIAGTHGKTTTTFLTDHLLSQSGKKPGLFAGGVRADGMDGFRIGESEYFVIEGDEYDTAFFDKHSKFMHYRPWQLILTSIEFDHADIFNSMDEYLTAFKRVIRLVPSRGGIIANAAYPHIKNILKDYRFSHVQYYGPDRLKKKFPGISTYSMKHESVHFSDFNNFEKFPLIGEFNAANALASSLASFRTGLSKEQIHDGIASFPGVLRRQQIRVDRIKCGVTDSPVTFIEDFAHHPTAVKTTIEAIRNRYPGRKIWVLFEPRSATSHRKIFQEEYVHSFKKANYVLLTDVFNPEKVRAGDKLNVKKLLSDIEKSGTAETFYAPSADNMMQLFKKQFKQNVKGDVIAVMSNGAFGGIYKEMDVFLNSL